MFYVAGERVQTAITGYLRLFRVLLQLLMRVEIGTRRQQADAASGSRRSSIADGAAVNDNHVGKEGEQHRRSENATGNKIKMVSKSAWYRLKWTVELL